jgi:hypothetical protein
MFTALRHSSCLVFKDFLLDPVDKSLAAFEQEHPYICYLIENEYA